MDAESYKIWPELDHPPEHNIAFFYTKGKDGKIYVTSKLVKVQFSKKVKSFLKNKQSYKGVPLLEEGEWETMYRLLLIYDDLIGIPQRKIFNMVKTILKEISNGKS